MRSSIACFIVKRLVLSMVACVVGTTLCGTTIVVYVTPQFVLMAADSKAVFTNVANNKETVSIVSKIYQRKNIFFALAGVTANTTRNFDVARTVDGELKNFTSWPQVTSSIKTTVEKALLPYLVYMKKNHRKLYYANLEATDYFTSLCLAGIKDAKPYVHLFGFKVLDGATLKIATEELYYGKENLKDAVYYLGQKEAINAYMNGVNQVTTAPEKFVESLVNLQVKSTPALVGGPVDILRITPARVEWIKRKKGTPVILK